MFLRKELNGMYYIYYDSKKNNKRTKLSTKTKNKLEAEKVYNDYKKRHELNIIGFQEFLDLYGTKKTNDIKEKVLNQHITILKNFFNYLTTQHNIKYINDIKQEHVDSYKNFLFTNKNKTTTIKTKLTIITGALLIATEAKILELKLKAPKIKITQVEKDFLNTNELNELLTNCKSLDLKDAILFASQTGLRLQELINLKWHNINFDTKFLTLNNKDFITKNKETRDVPLTDTALEILQSRYNAFKQTKNDFVFTYKNSKWHTTTLQYQINKLTKNTFGKSKKITFHNLRHSCTTALDNKGVGIYTIQGILGHKNITTTQRYCHTDKQQKQNAIQLIDYKTLLNKQ